MTRSVVKVGVMMRVVIPVMKGRWMVVSARTITPGNLNNCLSMLVSVRTITPVNLNN